VIRVVVVDDHPALRAGLRTVLDGEPGLVFAGETGDQEGLWPLLARARPDLVLLDYHLRKGDGLQLCYRIKQDALAPRVLVYTAYASRALALPAALARADAVVDKGLPARELFEVIRQVNRGEQMLVPVSRTLLADAHERLEPEDRPLVSMTARPRRRRPRRCGSTPLRSTTGSSACSPRFALTSPAPRRASYRGGGPCRTLDL
jgi:DNA-binding NarL/FixJ family response regulator